MSVINTNVWIYLNDRRDQRKHAIAKQLVAQCDDLILPWQVGCEFMSASWKLVQFGFTSEMAWDTLQDMQQLADRIVLPDPADWIEARLLQASDMLAFWDARLVALCLRDRSQKLYTEDMGSPRKIRSLELINPFV
jgi:predicted nucleic acid-binding protein